MKSLFERFKKFIDSDDSNELAAHEESFLFLRSIVSSLREDGSYLVNGEIFLQGFLEYIHRNLNTTETKLVLARFNPTFCAIDAVLKAKPFLSCKLSTENRQAIIELLMVFHEELKQTLEEGMIPLSEMPVLTLDDLLATTKEQLQASSEDAKKRTKDLDLITIEDFQKK